MYRINKTLDLLAQPIPPVCPFLFLYSVIHVIRTQPTTPRLLIIIINYNSNSSVQAFSHSQS